MATTNDPARAAAASSSSNAPPSLGSSSATPVISTVGDATISFTAEAQGGEQVGPEVARGAFIVLEGMDRSGKTTQVKLLQSRFIEAGRKVQLMRFPGELLGFFFFLSFFWSEVGCDEGWMGGICDYAWEDLDGTGRTDLKVHGLGQLRRQLK